nr:uncharacterized protein LOC111420980 [Onthophagus taurus]
MCQKSSENHQKFQLNKEAKKFLDVLICEGGKSRCDETSEVFRSGMKIPEYYDKEKFKRGQQFFHRNIFAMLFGKFLGLISDLTLISSQKILEHTNQSNEPKTAFKRYVSTIFSMYTWYTYDLIPGSKSWESLKRIRTIHNFASLKCHKNQIGEIAQYHMALAQFGFMGLIVSKSEKIGIFPNQKEMDDFIHFWRVIGHMLGIEEKYNICRETFKETKEICDEIIAEIISPALNEWDESFLKMTRALIEGMWSMMPVLQFKVFLNLLYLLINNNNQDKDVEILQMNYFEKSYYKYGLNYKHSKFVESSNFNYTNFN